MDFTEVKTVKILLHGSSGRMGREVSRLIAKNQACGDDVSIVCGVDPTPLETSGTYPLYPSLEEVPKSLKMDIIIDFSHHSAVAALLDFGLSRQIPLVICTSGFTDKEEEMIAKASPKIPVLKSANMSLGINLLLSLVARAAQVLSDDFDIEIVERHHNQKIDSPSGTALMIAKAINTSLGNRMRYVYGRHGREAKVSKRKTDEIGIHALRGGAIVGEHEVIFAGQEEVFEIKHSALSRNVFAHGAIKAAKFLMGRNPGLYNMKDVVEAI